MSKLETIELEMSESELNESDQIQWISRTDSELQIQKAN